LPVSQTITVISTSVWITPTLKNQTHTFCRDCPCGGGDVTDVRGLIWFVTYKTEYLAYKREVGKAYQPVFGKHFPAMSLVVVNNLIEDESLVEIEANAYIAQD
jgi:enamine deaminase RidA (YjgF/YER057c/UK114 family)